MYLFDSNTSLLPQHKTKSMKTKNNKKKNYA